MIDRKKAAKQAEYCADTVKVIVDEINHDTFQHPKWEDWDGHTTIQNDIVFARRQLLKLYKMLEPYEHTNQRFIHHNCSMDSDYPNHLCHWNGYRISIREVTELNLDNLLQMLYDFNSFVTIVKL